MIGDFGISKILSCSTELAKTSLGTPYYLSPEICAGQPYDYKSDMWMIGCILYEIVTGSKPFQGDSLPTILKNIVNLDAPSLPNGTDQQLVNICGMLLQKNPNLRASSEELC